MNINSITRRIPKGKRQSIFSWGSRACQHATSPLCRPILGGSAAKRCCMNLVHTIWTPQEPTHNDMSNLLGLPFSTPPGKVRIPSQSPEMAMNNHQLVLILLHCTKPSRWWQPPRATSESHSKTRTPSVRSRWRTRGGELSFLKIITSANQNKCGIKTIGLAKTTPLYLCSLVPSKDTN